MKHVLEKECYTCYTAPVVKCQSCQYQWQALKRSVDIVHGKTYLIECPQCGNGGWYLGWVQETLFMGQKRSLASVVRPMNQGYYTHLNRFGERTVEWYYG